MKYVPTQPFEEGDAAYIEIRGTIPGVKVNLDDYKGDIQSAAWKLELYKMKEEGEISFTSLAGFTTRDLSTGRAYLVNKYGIDPEDLRGTSLQDYFENNIELIERKISSDTLTDEEKKKLQAELKELEQEQEKIPGDILSNADKASKLKRLGEINELMLKGGGGKSYEELQSESQEIVELLEKDEQRDKEAAEIQFKINGLKAVIDSDKIFDNQRAQLDQEL